MISSVALPLYKIHRIHYVYGPFPEQHSRSHFEVLKDLKHSCKRYKKNFEVHPPPNDKHFFFYLKALKGPKNLQLYWKMTNVLLVILHSTSEWVMTRHVCDDISAWFLNPCSIMTHWLVHFGDITKRTWNRTAVHRDVWFQSNESPFFGMCDIKACFWVSNQTHLSVYLSASVYLSGHPFVTQSMCISWLEAALNWCSPKASLGTPSRRRSLWHRLWHTKGLTSLPVAHGMKEH